MRLRNKIIVITAVITVLATATAVVVVMNVASFGPKVTKPLETDYSVGDPLFMRMVDTLLGPPFTDGNTIEPLRNGDEIFPAMLQAIRDAERTINFETYVYWRGDIAETFAETLADRARDGVQVRLLLDWMGSDKMRTEWVTLMEDAGVMVERFRPLKWYNLNRANNRTHRKLLIVDGKVGFTGGVGIGQEWTGNAQDDKHWRDTHFRLTGPVVGEMQAGFAANWMQTHRELIQGIEHFPELTATGTVKAQAFNSTGQGGAESIRTLFLLAIAGAEKNIRIGSPYFVPDPFLMGTLINALERGVKIEVITPGKQSDSQLARAASRALWGQFLQKGGEIYRFEPTLYHTKVMIVDDIFVSVGSANFDNRSFQYNEENNVNILDADFAANMVEQFNRDKQRSSPVSYAEWKNRPWSERFMEWWSSLFRSQV